MEAQPFQTPSFSIPITVLGATWFPPQGSGSLETLQESGSKGKGLGAAREALDWRTLVSLSVGTGESLLIRETSRLFNPLKEDTLTLPLTPGRILLPVLQAQCMPMGFPGGSDGKESACDAGDLGLIPGSGRSPGGGHGNPLQYFCLENPMDREA